MVQSQMKYAKWKKPDLKVTHFMIPFIYLHRKSKQISDCQGLKVVGDFNYKVVACQEILGGGWYIFLYWW